MLGIIKKRLTDNIRIKAKKYVDKFGNAQSFSIREKANWIGWVGRIALMEFMNDLGAKCRLKRLNDEIFLTIDDKWFQVKTATKRTMLDPRPNWSAIVDLPNFLKWENHNSHLFFVFYYEDIGITWFIGHTSREKFREYGKVYTAGETVGSLKTKHDMIEMQISNLELTIDWITKNGYKNTIMNINEIKNKIIKIIKKYKRKIYKKQGDLSDYVFQLQLHKYPSQYKVRAQHVKVAKQYADMVRRETNQPELTDDEITPPGMIATFIKNKEGQLFDELATNDDIYPPNYIAGLESSMGQLIEPFGININDTKVNYQSSTDSFHKQLKLTELIKKK